MEKKQEEIMAFPVLKQRNSTIGGMSSAQKPPSLVEFRVSKTIEYETNENMPLVFDWWFLTNDQRLFYFLC
ncbi:hypothetical protein HYU50_02840 [Candidatus Woesearchaeota archaeon]|nr:hypothetical protein [Candidatus Woesearchaeota archaeon]